MRIIFFWLLFHTLGIHGFGHASTDIVFDIDQTIATLIHEGAYGDLLKDPDDPDKGVVSITWEAHELDEFNKPILNANGDLKTTPKLEKYRLYEGLVDLLSELKKQQESGRVKISFFSGGFKNRNETLLKHIILDDGSSALDLVTDSNGKARVFNRNDMTSTGLGGHARVRDRFKKDLTLVNKNLDDVILVDDIKTFALQGQEGNVLWLGENFPYPERVKGTAPKIPDRFTIQRERYKMYWIADVLLDAIDRNYQDGVPIASSIKATKDNPFTETQDTRFLSGKLKLLRAKNICNPQSALRVLLNFYDQK